MLDDYAGRVERERVVATADDDFAFAMDVDPIVTITGDHRVSSKNVNVNVAATRNTDAVAHWTSPLVKPLMAGTSLCIAANRTYGQPRRNVTEVITGSQSRFNLITVNKYLSASFFWASC